MTEKIFLFVCLVLIATLTACSSQVGVGTSAPVAESIADGESEPGSDAMVSTPAGEITPNPSDVVFLDESFTMRVLWTVSGYVLGPGHTGDEQAAQAYLAKPLDVTDTAIIFDGQTCKGVTFQRETVNAAEYLSDAWNVTPLDLGVDVQELQVIKTDCGLPGFGEYVRLGDGRLIVPIDGVFYFFEPAVAR